MLFAPTAEERDLWVNGFNRVMQIPVIDPNFVPMGVMTKQQLNLHEQIMQTEGNNMHTDPASKVAAVNLKAPDKSVLADSKKKPEAA